MEGASFGFGHFLASADGLARTLLAAMVLASVVSWVLILERVWGNWRERRAAKRFLAHFWAAPDLTVVAEQLCRAMPEGAHARLTCEALEAARHHAQHGAVRLAEAGSLPDFLTRVLRRGIELETARRERGLTLLASIGSTAPFVGLFGTVWGIHSALVAIGMSGQGTLDKVAGPVGEALIMTAAGLAVAIPAVLAYNAFTRGNRLAVARLEAYAHDLLTLLTTGQAPAARVRLREAA